jgi:hypothetical protein
MRDQRDIEQIRLRGPDRGEAAPMNGRGAEAPDGIEVIGGGVAFVDGEAVSWVEAIEFDHALIAKDLGDDAGGGDAVAAAVALDKGGMRHGQGGDRQTIDQGMNGSGFESLEGAAHGGVGGPQDVHGVDRGRIDFGDCEGNMMRAQPLEERFAPGRLDLFGIVESQEIIGQAPFDPAVGEDEGDGDDRSGQRTASGFIDTGEGGEATGQERPFDLKPVDVGRPRHGGDCGVRREKAKPGSRWKARGPAATWWGRLPAGGLGE